jgi:hypothetical protein
MLGAGDVLMNTVGARNTKAVLGESNEQAKKLLTWLSLSLSISHTHP